MTSDNWFPVFVDADVLASPLTRTVLILAGTHPASVFSPRWSLAVEAEADRHLRGAQDSLRRLRDRFDWGAEVIVPDGSSAAAMSDTSRKDRAVLDAAAQAGIGLIVTRNIADFGPTDLAALGVAAVHPDLFLSLVMTQGMYRTVLAGIAGARQRAPNTPQTLHAALGAQHPLLFAAMSGAYPGVNAAADGHRPPRWVFRGPPTRLGGILFDAPDRFGTAWTRP
ncbi:MAG: hypothetical protein LBD90_01550 [Bifidobacteriaceae bacterium]|jgi:hypothetical protein|nr:hypothetical protein [Bifidobacteriaceae bacterium]